ncbi:MAG: Ferritin-like protein [Frankiales bacterium]|nr:Ferritin-like protein [Frankiales bacterium]
MSNDDMQISEVELQAMTAHMVEMHEETYPIMRASMADLGSDLRATGARVGGSIASRRGFLTGGTAVVGGLLLAACSSTSGKAGAASPQPSSGSSGSSGGDQAALATNASLENLAVFAYGAALKAAPTGKFGKTVPAAVAQFAAVAMKQHQDHADAFNAALRGAGGTPYTKPDPALTPAVLKMFGAVKSVPGLAMLAITLENTAAATYIQQMGTLTSASAIAAVATIAPVERQHAAILSFVLGDYPVPDTFVKLIATPTSLGARPNTDAA